MQAPTPTLFAVLLTALSSPCRSQTPVTAKDLDQAIGALVDVRTYPYPTKTNQGYPEGDYFDANGQLQMNKNWQQRDSAGQETSKPAPEPKWKPCVDCATFAGPVLHHLCTGSLEGFKATDAWAKENGAGMVKHFGLAATCEFDKKELVDNLGKPEWCKKNAGTYFFDLDGKHVGFLVLKEDGTHRQVHFSAASKVGPLDNGDMPAYLKGEHGKSFEKATLYKVVRPQK